MSGGLPGFCPSVQPARPVETSWTRHPREEIGTLGFIRNFTFCGFDALRSVNRYISLVCQILQKKMDVG